MDYTLLEMARILGKSKSTMEYQVRKLTDHQKGAFLFVDESGVKHINEAGYDYFKALYEVPEELQKNQPADPLLKAVEDLAGQMAVKDQTADTLLKAVEALTAQLAVKDEQIRMLAAQLENVTGKLTDREEPKKLPWYRRK